MTRIAADAKMLAVAVGGTVGTVALVAVAGAWLVCHVTVLTVAEYLPHSRHWRMP